MRSLFITLNDINTNYSGGSVCSLRNLRLLSELGETDTFVINSNKIEKVISSVFLLFPPFSIIAFVKIINRINRTKPDIVFFDTSLLGRLVKFLYKRKGLKTIVFFHNVEIDYLDVRFGKSANKYLYSWLCKYNESLSLKYSHSSICLNKRDQDRLETIYSIQPEFIVPITLNSTYAWGDMIEKYRSDNKQNKSLLFVGSLNRSNYISVKWFIDNVMTVLDKSIQLTIIGKDFETKRTEFESDRITVIGTSDNLEEYYFKSMCVISPIFEGAGMKVKIAEALMYGCVIAASDEALEGYETNNQSVFRCNNIEEFKMAIQNISESDNLYEHTQASRLLFEKHYSDKSAADIFHKAVNN
jgi:hypothetical protein